MPMFKSSRSAAIPGNSSGGHGPNESEMQILRKTKNLQRSLSNSTPASLGDEERYSGIETEREELEEIRQSPPTSKTSGYAARANAAAAQTKQYVYPKDAPANVSSLQSPIAIASRSNSNVSSSSVTPSVLRKKRVITPHMVKRRSINIKNLPLVMKSDESHASASKNSVVTEQTEKASNRKDSKRRQSGYVFGIKKLETTQSRGTFDTAGTLEERKKLLPPLSPGLKPNPTATGRSGENSVDKVKLADKENASKASNTFKRKEGSSHATEKETKEVRGKKVITNESAIPLTKRVPSGQSCSAFFLSDASSSAMSDPTKDNRRGSLKVSPVKRTAMVRDDGIKLKKKDDVVTKVNTDNRDGSSTMIVKQKAIKEIYALSKEGSTVSKESLESLAEYSIPLKNDTHTYREKSTLMSQQSRTSGKVTPSFENYEKHQTASLSIDTKVVNYDMSGPVSPLLSPRKKEEFEVELPADQARTREICDTEESKGKEVSLKHLRSVMPNKEVAEETSRKEENVESVSNTGMTPEERLGTEEPQTFALKNRPKRDETNEEGTEDVKACPPSDQTVDIDAVGIMPIEKAATNNTTKVIKVKQTVEHKPETTCSSTDEKDPVKPDKYERSSSHSPGSNEDNIQENCASNNSTPSPFVSGKPEALDNTPNDSPPSLSTHIKMDDIGKIDVALLEDSSGRSKKKESGRKKKKQMIMTSFIGKKSKVIKEDAEYVVEAEEEAINFTCAQVKTNENENMNINVDEYRDQASDEFMDIHLQATLSDCEFSSVQSSVTTDKAFDTQPSIIKRTSSFIRNPLLRRNRSKKTEMDELLQCMKNGKLAARMDNKKVEEFDENPTGDGQHPNTERIRRDSKKHKINNAQGTKEKKSMEAGSKRTVDSDDEEPCTEEQQSSGETNSDEIYSVVDESDEDPITNDRSMSVKTASFAESADDSSDMRALTSKNTFENSLMRPSVKLPDVDDSAKIEVRSPSFRLSAMSGSGAPRMPSPLAQQVLLHALNNGTQTEMALNEGTQTESVKFPLIRNVSAGSVRGTLSHGDHGTQTSDDSVHASTFTFTNAPESQPNTVIYPLTQNASNGSRGIFSVGHGAQASSTSTAAPSTSFGTFGDVIESIGLFSARVCLGTGAAIASCSRACNDKPYFESASTILPSNSFVEPEMHLSPRNAVFSPQNTVFRAAYSPPHAPDGYTQVLAEAISHMPEEEQLNLVRQLSNRSLRATSRSLDDFDDMASSVDGMFRQRGVSRRKKRVPRNIAVKPKPLKKIEVPTLEQKNLNQQPEIKRVSSTGKKSFGGIKNGFKRLAKTRLAVMYQV